MRVLLTGAFGNLGQHTLKALIEQGHKVRCFDLPARRNKNLAAKAVAEYGDQIEVVWGDIRMPTQVQDAVRGQDVVLHLAFIVPAISATGVDMNRHAAWAREINVTGTKTLLEAIRTNAPTAKVLFASSVSVFGPTLDMSPPRRVTDPVNPVDAYARQKVECEHLVRESGLTWSVMRLSAAVPMELRGISFMFEIPLDTRMEFLHPRDAALAFARAVGSEDIWGRVLLIGGGASCQYRFGEMVGSILDACGVDMLPEEAFTSRPYYTDWLDTAESQRLLNYQQHDLHDYTEELRGKLGFRWQLARAFRSPVRRWLLSKSRCFAGNVMTA